MPEPMIMGQNSFTEAQFKNTPAKNPKYTPNPPKGGVALLCIFLPPGRSKICKPKASFLKKNVEIYVTRKETIRVIEIFILLYL